MHGAWLGSYEYEIAKYFRGLLQPGMRVFDIGANVGVYSVLAGRLGADVVAVEPLPQNLEYLRRHVALNAINHRVRVVGAAVGAYDGAVRFNPARSRSEGFVHPEGALTIEQVTLDSLSAAYGAPDVVKIDVEGAEEGVLAGASETIQLHRPTLLVALHLGFERSRALWQRLEDCGYCVRSDAGTSRERAYGTLVAVPN